MDAHDPLHFVQIVHVRNALQLLQHSEFNIVRLNQLLVFEVLQAVDVRVLLQLVLIQGNYCDQEVEAGVHFDAYLVYQRGALVQPL